MTHIRLLGIGAAAGANGLDRLRKLTGFNLISDGADLLIPDNDSSLDMSRLRVFQLGEILEVGDEKNKLIAESYLDSLSEYESYGGQKPNGVPTYSKLGLVAEYKREQIDFFFSDRDQLAELINTRTCPFMQDRFDAKNAVALRIDATTQQAVLSFAKIALLSEQFSPDDVKKINFDSKSLACLLPHPAHMLSYFNALLFHAPLAIALPMVRVGSALLFLPEKPKMFVSDANRGLFETMASSIDPMSEREIEVVIGSDDFGATGQRRYIVLLAEGLNRLMAYLNDFRNYQDSTGVVRFQMFVQAHSSVFLIFSELLAMNFVNSPYIKQKIAYSILNKIANLKRFVGGCEGKESKLFRGLFKHGYGKCLAGTFRYHVRPVYEQLANRLVSATHQTYETIHQHVNRVLGTNDEESVLHYLSSLRNATEHGAFLDGAQFERTFLLSEGSVPAELVNLPFLMVLAMTFEPRRVLGYCE